MCHADYSFFGQLIATDAAKRLNVLQFKKLTSEQMSVNNEAVMYSSLNIMDSQMGRGIIDCIGQKNETILFQVQLIYDWMKST